MCLQITTRKTITSMLRTRPTSTWTRGEIVEDQHTLTIHEDAFPGVYRTEIGLYLQEDGFPRLGVMGTYDNSLILPSVRIESDDS